MTANEALRQARIAAGMTLRTLAEQVGMSQQHLSDIEQGHRAVTDALALRLPEPIGKAVRAVLAQQYEAKAVQMRRR